MPYLTFESFAELTETTQQASTSMAPVCSPTRSICRGRVCWRGWLR